VPPTVAIANRRYGQDEAPVVFGWVAVGHQIGAAAAAFGGGLVRQEWGTYAPAFVIAGGLGVLAAMAIVMFAKSQRRLEANI
jgi:predicted MFS family arabinose efflux permease